MDPESITELQTVSREVIEADKDPDVDSALKGERILTRKDSHASVLDVEKGHAKGSGLTEGDQDMPDLPDNNLLVVVPCIGLVLFLAAVDQTIVATALPTVAQELDATPAEYSWVGTAYMLAMTLLTPLNGRLSDIIGRKPMLYFAIVCFTVASGVCGAAKNMTWLIVARLFQGAGGGSIIGLTNIVIADIVPLSQRGMYQGLLGASWGVAAAVGPILGGSLTEKVSWRWCFYINLPTCGVALILLFLTLKLNPTSGYTLKMFSDTFDFPGLVLVMAGGALTIVGFAFAADNGFDKASTIALIVVGFVLIVAAVINFLFTKRNAIIPPRAFKTRTPLFFIIGSTLHATAFIPTNWLLPQFFQGVRGSDSLQAGIYMLPFACSVAWIIVLGGFVTNRFGITRPIAWIGYALAALGSGLIYHFFTPNLSIGTQVGLEIVAGLGAGCALQVPLLIVQSSMPFKDMAAVTSAWTLTRSIGGSIGIALFTAILNSDLRSKFSQIPGYGIEFNVPTSTAGYKALHDLPAGTTRDLVLDAMANSFKPCWLIQVVLYLVALAITVWTKYYSLDRDQPKRNKSSPTASTSTESSSSDETAPATTPLEEDVKI